MNDRRVQVYAGIDWGSQTHQACVLDNHGKPLGERSFAHNGEGIGTLLRWLAEFAGGLASQVRVAIEVPHGPVVESLLAADFAVHSINPRQLDRFRDRFSPSGCKDDRRDAEVLADSLRTDGHCFRTLQPASPQVMRLRSSSRLREELVAERTRLINRIRQKLWNYYPQFNQVIGNRLQSWHLELWQRAPTPQAAVELHANTIRAILKRHRIRRLDAKQVRQMLRSKPLPLDPVAAEGNAEHVDSLAQRLQLVERQIGEIETKLERHIAEFSEVPHPEDTDAALEDPQRPNDTQILRSMPGIGVTVASVLLSEAHNVLARRDYESLRCLSGVAPVTRQSGKSRVVRRRRAADRRLSDALYHWARIAIQRDSVSRAKYTACRARGHSHGRALRTVADRLLYVVCTMLRNATLYQPPPDPQPSASAP